MTEIKQLFSNRLLRKIGLGILFALSTAIMVVISHPYWRKHWSWIELTLLVASLQLICIALWFGLKSIPWRRIGRSGKARVQRVWAAWRVFQMARVGLKRDIRSLRRYLMLKRGRSVAWFLRRWAYPKLPWYFCFSVSKSDWATKLQSQKAWHPLPFRLTTLSEGKSRCYDIQVFEEGIAIVLFPELIALSNWAWRYFLRGLKALHYPKSRLSVLISTDLTLVKTASEECQKALRHIRHRVDAASRIWGSSLPVFGVIEGFESILGFTALINAYPALFEKEIPCIDLDPKQIQEPGKLISRFTDLLNKWKNWRFHAIHPNEERDHIWSTFLSTSYLAQAFEELATVWQALTKTSAFFLPTNLCGAYILLAQEQAKGLLCQALSTWSTKRVELGSNRETRLKPGILAWGCVTAIVLFVVAIGLNGWQCHHRLKKYESIYRDFEENLANLSDEAAGSALLSLFECEQMRNTAWFSGLFGRWLDQPSESSYLTQPLMQLLTKQIRPSTDILSYRLMHRNAHWPRLPKSEQDAQRSDYYDDLKHYLILTNQAPLPIAQKRMALMQTLRIPDQQVERYTKLFDWYVKQGGASGLRAQDIIDDAKQHLAQISGLTRFKAYLQTLSESPDWGTPMPLGIVERYGSESIRLHQQVKKCYSRKAWETQIKPWIEGWVSGKQDDWVVQVQGQPNERESLMAYYQQQRADAWKRFFQGIELKLAHNLNDSLRQLTDFLEPEGAWQQLLRVVAEESGSETIRSETDVALGDWRKIRNFFSEGETPLNAEKSITPGHGMASNHVNATRSSRLSKSTYLGLLSTVRGEWDSLVWSPEMQIKSEGYLAQIFSEGKQGKNGLMEALESVTALERSSKKEDVFQAWLTCLKAPLLSALSGIIRDGSLGLQADWKSLAQKFEQELGYKFPFTNVPEEVTLHEFAQYFRPEHGLVTQFMNERLRPYCQNVRGRWVSKRWMGMGLPFSSTFLANLEQVDRIANGLFQPNSDKVAWVFQVLPKPSPYFSEFSLESNAENHVYRNDPEEWKIMTWPGDVLYPKAKLSVIPVDTQKTQTVSYTGEWAIFRLFREEAELKRVSEGNYLAYFQLATKGKTKTQKTGLPATVDERSNEAQQVVFQIKMDASRDVFSLFAGKNGFHLAKQF